MTMKIENGVYKVKVQGDFVPLESARHIRRWSELLQDIADGLSQKFWRKIPELEVIFVADKDEYRFTVVQALDAIANDLYFDERGDWSEATSARVETL